jgi:hypothetical protein
VLGAAKPTSSVMMSRMFGASLREPHAAANKVWIVPRSS